jgi:hypothetical protein
MKGGAKQTFECTLFPARGVAVQLGRILYLAIGAAVCVAAGLPAAARGQQEPYAAKGRLVSLEPGILVIKTSKGTHDTIKFLMPGNKRKAIKGKGSIGILEDPLYVQITGEISPSQLTPGTLVRFRGLVDKDGNVTSDVSEVTALLDPKKDERAGLYPDQAEEGAKGEGTPLLVKGIVASNRKGTLIVNVGVKGENTNKGKVTAKLTDLTTVKVESENLARIRVGDDVEVEGILFDKREIAGLKLVVIRSRTGKPIGRSPSDAARSKPDSKKESAADDSDEANPDEGEKKKKKGKTVIVN